MNEVSVLLLSCVWYISLHTASARQPLICYECSTERYEYYCDDHFNKTDHVRTIQCKDACIKWVRKPKNGPTHIIRTCSDTLDMKMHWGYVCMKESRPGDGKLCFCNDDYCNQATTLGHNAIISVSILCVTWALTSALTSWRGLALTFDSRTINSTEYSDDRPKLIINSQRHNPSSIRMPSPER